MTPKSVAILKNIIFILTLSFPSSLNDEHAYGLHMKSISVTDYSMNILCKIK